MIPRARVRQVSSTTSHTFQHIGEGTWENNLPPHLFIMICSTLFPCLFHDKLDAYFSNSPDCRLDFHCKNVRWWGKCVIQPAMFLETFIIFGTTFHRAGIWTFRSHCFFTVCRCVQRRRMVIGWASGVCLLAEMVVGSNNDREELILKTLHCYLNRRYMYLLHLKMIKRGSVR